MTLDLRAEARATKTQGELNILRSGEKIPGVIFGHGIKNQTISLDYKEFAKLYAQAGESSIINLVVGDAKPQPVLIADIQRDPVRGAITHVDLHQVRMDEKLKAHISLRIVGESPAVKGLGANLIVSKDELSVECLPKDLVAHIDVDISTLVALDQSLRIRDISVPAAITVLDDPEETIVSALAPREEKIETLVETTVEAEVVAKKEGAEEGALAAPEEKEG